MRTHAAGALLAARLLDCKIFRTDVYWSESMTLLTLPRLRVGTSVQVSRHAALQQVIPRILGICLYFVQVRPQFPVVAFQLHQISDRYYHYARPTYAATIQTLPPCPCPPSPVDERARSHFPPFYHGSKHQRQEISKSERGGGQKS